MEDGMDAAPDIRRDAALYDLLMDAAGAIYAVLAAARASEAASSPPPILQLRGGLAESPGWFLLQAAEFDPEPLTVAGLRVRDIYASERIVAALLDLLASEGWLDRDLAGAYALTAAGRTVLDTILARRQRLIAHTELLQPQDLDRLAELLGRIVTASLAVPDPPGVWCLAHSRRRAPPPDAPVLAILLQLFEDLNAFRDDSHMAAWQPLGVTGHAWEAFAHVAGDQAATPADLFRTLAYRGYSEREYADALGALADRGWLERSGAQEYRLSDAGRQVRAAVEQATDGFFYAPWQALQPHEFRTLIQLLQALRAVTT